MMIAIIPMTLIVVHNRLVLNNEFNIVEDVMNFGLKKYVMTDKTVDRAITPVITSGKKPSNKAMKYSVMTPSRILKLPSASMIGTRKMMIPNNDGIRNFIKLFVVISLLSELFSKSLITPIPLF